MAKADEELTRAVDNYRKALDAAKGAATPPAEQPPPEQPPAPGGGR